MSDLRICGGSTNWYKTIIDMAKWTGLDYTCLQRRVLVRSEFLADMLLEFTSQGALFYNSNYCGFCHEGSHICNTVLDFYCSVRIFGLES